MLLKLLKYDFRAMWKQFSLVWGAALALALVNRFTMFRDLDNNLFTNSEVFMLAFIAVIAAMLVIAVIFVVSRFSKGLLGNVAHNHTERERTVTAFPRSPSHSPLTVRSVLPRTGPSLR